MRKGAVLLQLNSPFISDLQILACTDTYNCFSLCCSLLMILYLFIIVSSQILMNVNATLCCVEVAHV